MPPAPSILIGTSGYSFPDWVGPFYPVGTRSGEFLNFYSGQFPVVEVNSTYYRIPHPKVLEQMEKKTPPGFRFVVKLNQSLTQEGSLAADLVRDFLAVLDPLKRANKYDGLLAQFPWSFQRTDSNRRHLEALRRALPEEPLFAEFRHASWVEPGLERWLSDLDVGYCAVDEPRLPGLMPKIAPLTSLDGYVRFHGRNTANWWGRGDRAAGRPGTVVVAPTGGRSAGSSDRYDWEYSESELREWVGKIAELASKARRTYLFFNNCHAGQAARSARLMQDLLRQQELGH